MDFTKDGKEIVFIRVPGHAGIRGNSSADCVAKDVLVGDTSVELIPFSDLKSHANKYYNCVSLSGMSSWEINYIKYFQF